MKYYTIYKINIIYKVMKKTILLSAVFLVTTGLNAQTRFGLSIAPAIGWVNHKFSEKQKGFEGKNGGSKMLFGGGVNIDHALAKNVSLMTGVEINYYGGKATISDSLRANPYTDVLSAG